MNEKLHTFSNDERERERKIGSLGKSARNGGK